MRQQRSKYKKALSLLYNTGFFLIKQGRSQLDLFAGKDKADLTALSEGRRFLQIAMTFDDTVTTQAYEEFYDTCST